MNYVSIYMKADSYIPGRFALCGGNDLRTAIELCDASMSKSDVEEYIDIFNDKGVVYISNCNYFDKDQVKNPEATFRIDSK